MHNRTCFNIVLFILSLCIESYAQIDSSTTASDIIDNLIEESAGDDEEDSERLFDDYEYLKSNPVNINTADIFDLQKLPLIDLKKAEQIIEYRKKNGKIFSAAELSSLNGFSPELITSISPFIITGLSDDSGANSIVKNNLFAPGSYKLKLRSRLTNSIQLKEGFTGNRYLGTPVKNYNRLQISKGNSAGINMLTDKDEGEKFINDFYSFNLWIKNYRFIKTFVAGDYIMEFGQGLALWGPYSNTKGMDAVAPAIKRQQGIRPYISSNENGYMRGVAASINLSDFSLTSYYSKNNIDSYLDGTGNNITSFKIDGYHRTDSELNNKRNSTEEIFGFVGEYSFNNFLKLGAIFSHTQYNIPVVVSNNYFTDAFYSYSFFYNLYLKRIELSGEVANDGKNYASITNLQYYFSGSVSIISSFRYYSAGYYNLRGSGFGGSKNISNEIGFYTGARLNTGIGKINLYIDIYRKPQSSYYCLFSTKAWELNFVWNSGNIKKSNILFRYNYSSREEKINTESKAISSPFAKNKIRLEYKKQLNNFILRSRIEYVYSFIKYTSKKEDGFAVLQDVRFFYLKSAEMYFRIISFRTTSYNSAIYEFENDLEGVFKSAALYGNGLRWYLIFKIKAFDNFVLSAKYSETYKPGAKTLGSGYSAIKGDTDDQIGVQVDWSL